MIRQDRVKQLGKNVSALSHGLFTVGLGSHQVCVPLYRSLAANLHCYKQITAVGISPRPENNLFEQNSTVMNFCQYIKAGREKSCTVRFLKIQKTFQFQPVTAELSW
jgi:hypothetical protein